MCRVRSEQVGISVFNGKKLFGPPLVGQLIINHHDDSGAVFL